ncbi:MAG: sulfotransferase domain-containing protein [Halieaceae bacterium]
MRTFSGLLPYYVVNEFPKSGGTWLAQMLSDALDVPFRRNAPIRFERSVTHGHFLYPLGLRNVVVLWRDPRDLLVSFYYHCYFINEHHNSTLVSMMKSRCPFKDYSNIFANLPYFIRFISETPVSPRFSWTEFVSVWARRPGTVQTSYAALRLNTAMELARVVHELTGAMLNAELAVEIADRHSFARAQKAAELQKKDGSEMSFVREGAVGNWQKHFSSDAFAAIRDTGIENSLNAIHDLVDYK